MGFTGRTITCTQVKLKQFPYVASRRLRDDETVHHRDGNPFNNDIANLELRSGQHGCGATKYTEEVNRLLSMLPRQIDAKMMSLAEYAEADHGS